MTPASLTPAQREDLLQDELTRPVPSGLRPFSPGIVRLIRKIVLPGASEQDEERGYLAMIWLMDERHTPEQIHAAAECGADFLRSEELAAYEFALDYAFYVAAKIEIVKSNQAIAAAAFTIQPKPPQPGGKAPPAEPGNS